jgi:hypothetical protein
LQLATPAVHAAVPSTGRIAFVRTDLESDDRSSARHQVACWQTLRQAGGMRSESHVLSLPR